MGKASRGGRFVRGFYATLLFIFLYAPILVMIVYSFNSSKSLGVWGGFSLKWYQELFRDTEIMQALTNTLSIAAMSALVSTVVGTAAAFGIHYMRKRSKSLVMSITNLPVINPDIVTGVSLLLLFVFVGFSLGYVSLLLAHISFCIPYVIISVLPKLSRMNASTYEAALDLGANPVQAFFKAVLPEIMPSVLTGGLLALTLSIDDFVVSFFTTGPGVTTLSIHIYTMARRGIKPEINALSTIMFVVVFVLLLVVNLRTVKDERKDAKPKRPER
ncbi:MAG: ABC transporter permease [Clostridia bacterium]|nr:ABC transporter permease [Clostridia bacterium]